VLAPSNRGSRYGPPQSSVRTQQLWLLPILWLTHALESASKANDDRLPAAEQNTETFFFHRCVEAADYTAALIPPARGLMYWGRRHRRRRDLPPDPSLAPAIGASAGPPQPFSDALPKPAPRCARQSPVGGCKRRRKGLPADHDRWSAASPSKRLARLHARDGAAFGAYEKLMHG
jgi:hypothetical protein